MAIDPPGVVEMILRRLLRQAIMLGCPTWRQTPIPLLVEVADVYYATLFL
jgi:hypothetical protein